MPLRGSKTHETIPSLQILAHTHPENLIKRPNNKLQRPINMSDQTYHMTKEDMRKPESKASAANNGNVPANSDAAAAQVSPLTPSSCLYPPGTNNHPVHHRQRRRKEQSPNHLRAPGQPPAPGPTTKGLRLQQRRRLNHERRLRRSAYHRLLQGRRRAARARYGRRERCRRRT